MSAYTESSSRKRKLSESEEEETNDALVVQEKTTPTDMSALKANNSSHNSSSTDSSSSSSSDSSSSSSNSSSCSSDSSDDEKSSNNDVPCNQLSSENSEHISNPHLSKQLLGVRIVLTDVNLERTQETNKIKRVALKMKRKTASKIEKTEQRPSSVVKSVKKKPQDSHILKQLKSICHAAGFHFMRYRRLLSDCTSDHLKEEALKQFLADQGMKGEPTMKKAVELKLRKEAAELDLENIISHESRSNRRSLHSKNKDQTLFRRIQCLADSDSE